MGKRFIFLGGIFSSSQSKYIFDNSMGVVQNAADALQKKMIGGFDAAFENGLHIVNLPFIGSYPYLFKKKYFPGVRESIGTNSSLRGVGFVNIWGLKLISRFFSSFFGLMSENTGAASVIFIYSGHTPFILAALLVRLLRPSTKICLIVPDLPEYMGGYGFFYSVLKPFDSNIFYFLAKRLDYFVCLTESMIERLGVSREKVVVVEGIASVSNLSPAYSERYNFDNRPRSILYTGTLARIYGIIDLVDAFMQIKSNQAELWICGDGDSKDYIIKAALLDNRIRYFGQVQRAEANRLQHEATILVNPRSPEGEFTKYSFPSKIMEYMSSGRPLIMHHLSGIPAEYGEFFIAPDGLGVSALADCMEKTLQLNSDELKSIGDRAKNFVLVEKNANKQTQKILDLIGD